MKDYYRVLGVSPDAETEVISAAYKAMMRKYHPDANSSATTSDKAKEINAAYETLKSPLRRREYDEQRERASESNKSQPPPREASQKMDGAAAVRNNSYKGLEGAKRGWVMLPVIIFLAFLIIYTSTSRTSSGAASAAAASAAASSVGAELANSHNAASAAASSVGADLASSESLPPDVELTTKRTPQDEGAER